MDVGPLRDAVTVALGFAMGVLSGLFGVGGGVISQPGMRLLGLEPIIVIGTALPVIIPGAASGTRRYWHERLIRWPAVVAAVPAGPGRGSRRERRRRARSRRWPSAAAHHCGSAAPVLVPHGPHHPGPCHPRSRWRRPTLRRPPPGDRRASTPRGRCVAIGVVAGGLSGLLGIGGGVIMVPAFVHFVRMEVKAAIATSLVCVGLFAVPGAITHALLGHVDWRVAAALIVGVIPGARVGASLAIRASDRRLRVTVATFLAITARGVRRGRAHRPRL